MKKLIRIYESIKILVGLCLSASLVLTVLNLLGITIVNWWLVMSPFIVVSCIPVLMYVGSFLFLFGRDLYGRYNRWKAYRLAKMISRELDELEAKIKG